MPFNDTLFNKNIQLMIINTLITPRPVIYRRQNHKVGAADIGIFGEEIETYKQMSRKPKEAYGAVSFIETNRYPEQ